MASENLPNQELEEVVKRYSSDRMHDLGYTVIARAAGHQERLAALFNFSIAAMAQDELKGDVLARSAGMDGPASWIYTAREIIESESESSVTGSILMHSIFFEGNTRILRGLNRWVCSKIPYDAPESAEDFAHDVLSGRMNMTNPRDN